MMSPLPVLKEKNGYMNVSLSVLSHYKKVNKRERKRKLVRGMRLSCTHIDVILTKKNTVKKQKQKDA